MERRAEILIVDDNPINLQVLSGILEQENYKVRAALSGEIALRAVEGGVPDLVLLDINMPGMSGFDTCRQFKARESTRDIPVIFLSAMQDVEDKIKAFKSGGVDYVTKPFQTEEILVRVKTHLDLYRIKRDLERMVAERTRDLKQSEARYRVLFEDSPLAVIVYDADAWTILETNAACTRMLGYPRGNWIGSPLGFAIDRSQQDTMRTLARSLTEHSEEAVFTGRLLLRHSDGYLVETEGIVQRIDYPGCRAHILMLQDVSERKKVEEQIRLEAREHRQKLEFSMRYDVLTGLPNRLLFTERMRQAFEQSRLTGSWMAICYVDIDNFAAINETHGRETADHLIINAAECLRGCLRGGDTLARVGGDEFALLVLGVHGKDDLVLFLESLNARLAEPFVSDTAVITLTVSIGVTICPLDPGDPDTLLRHADQAMMKAKQLGKGHYQFFDPEGDRRVRAHQETIEQMRQALSRREFVLYYQPKVDALARQVVGVEALIRWSHPERGLLPPGAFLPAVEEDPFAVDLGDWVIAEALEQMTRWQAIGLNVGVSVNIAAQHLMHESFIGRLQDLLEHHPESSRGALEIEVLETSRIDNMARVEEVIIACRALGVGFSLDDFGTGYSSLTYLRGLSADTLKIDQSFIRNMMNERGDLAIVSGVIGLANAFDRKVVAEGVETLEHAKLLLSLGCHVLQGYGVARPMPPEDVPGWIRAWPDASWAALTDGVS